MAEQANLARFIKKLLEAALVCPDCGGLMHLVAFIEEPRVVRTILVHGSLWDEPRPRPITPGAIPGDLECLPGVE